MLVSDNDKEYFDRQYRLRIYNADKTRVIELGRESDDKGRALHINFNVERTNGQVVNRSRITLWNLSKSTLDAMAENYSSIELYAGYGDRIPLIFRGNVCQMNTMFDGADRRTEIEAVDIYDTMMSGLVVLSERQISAYNLIEKIANNIGTPVMWSNEAKSYAKTKLITSYSYIGGAKDAMAHAGLKYGLQIACDNGVIYVTKGFNDSVSETMHLIDAKHGMIEMPKRIYNTGIVTEASSGSYVYDSLIGYEVKYFLDGSINAGDRVRIASSVVDGTFLVEKISISGDNYSGAWQCTANVIEYTLGGA